MNFVGKDLKFNGDDVWHKGNFTPPTSLPANGGNADTVDGKHASDFQELTNGGAYGLFPSTASTMVGNEYNVLLYAQERGYAITQTGSAKLNLTSLFDGKLAPTYSPNGVDPNDPLVITVSGLPNIHTQTGGVFGWTSRYYYPSKFKVEAYDSYNSRGWKTIIDKSTVYTPSKELLVPIYPSGLSGALTQFRITIYDTVGAVGSNGFNRIGLSEIFFCHPEAVAVNQYLDYVYSRLNHKHDADYEPKNSNIQSHISNKANPHGVTKAQVGLGSVFDYGLATQAEAESGTSNAKYMTPLRTKQAIDKFKPTKMSELENDIGAGGGIKITTSPTAPSSISPGDFWYKEVQ
ncbi:hypothetical protein CSV79_01515 [Sporosarcina sp. P13]|uniref:hypothetical protein n=1 Tax=Sporosarcina sp. P13 TaxID=2048263 RepID=UPI000C166AF4|nr:hypothetical protein [Sporosarcina sp. P13]PIC65328.1 hypothetical protein CSV79_01515 [Sporosarcina sp. P13]